MAAWLVRKLLTLDYGEVSFGRRRFRVDDRLRARLEAVPTRFLDGHHLAIETDDARELSKRIDEAVPVEFRGFAYEGAGMGLSLLDLLGLRAGAPLRFLETAGRPHDYIISVGAGFAVARVPWARWAPRRVAERFPPGLSSLVINGYGFHEAFFRPELTVGRGVVPRRIDADMSGYFDNGVGRALWFVEGAHPARIGAAIRRFPAERQRHLWTGLGLACAYAGLAYADMIEYAGVLAALKSEAGPLVAHLALGSGTGRREPAQVEHRHAVAARRLQRRRGNDAGTRGEPRRRKPAGSPPTARRQRRPGCDLAVARPGG